MYIEKDSVRFFFLPVEAAFFLDGVFFGGIVEGGWGLVEVLCVLGLRASVAAQLRSEAAAAQKLRDFSGCRSDVDSGRRGSSSVSDHDSHFGRPKRGAM